MQLIRLRACLPIALCITALATAPGCSRKNNPQAPGSDALSDKVQTKQAAPIQVRTSPNALPENPIATIQVDPLHLGAKIPRSFLGLSFEYPDVPKFVGTIRKPLPAFVNLVKQLSPFNGPPVIRIGGESQDESWFSNTRTQRPNNVRFTIDRDLVQSLDAAAQATQSKLILGVNLGADDPSIMLNWVEAALNDFLPEMLLAFELGNEPDNYQKHLVNGSALRGKHWDYDLYSKQFDHYKEMLLPHLKPRKLLAAPAFSRAFLPDAPNFIERQSMDVSLATLHYYALNGCEKSSSRSPDSAIETLLSSASSKNFFKEFGPVIRIAKRLSVPLRIDEVGPVSCAGMPDVSNSFASALWSLEFMFDFASAGGVGVNFTANPTSAPFLLSQSGKPQVLPLYYAMLFFARAIQNSSDFLPLTLEGSPGIRAWATLDNNGMIRIVLVNKEGSEGGTTVLHIPHTQGDAKIVRLTAPSLSSQSGVKIGEQTFDQTRDGTPLGLQTEESLSPTRQQYPVFLPPGSAALVSIQFNPS